VVIDPDADRVPLDPAEPFGAFFQREFFSMVALAQAVSGDPAAGEDIAAEAMLRASQRWDRLSGYDRPGAWVRRVTINLASNRRRRRATERRWLARQRPEESTTAGPEFDDVLWAAVASLPTKQRAAIALRYIDDLPVAEIADALGCTTSTATSHLHKARTTLAELLEKGAA